ncbi:MAG TPA: site-specific DNA-methyltransferase [Myxococcales bacterium]|nr:site-specific DNA-methyltransferase [Myxococcales bacterium]
MTACVRGDAREEETYRRVLGDARAGLLLTDPPYCLLTRRRKGGDLRDKRVGVKIDRDPVVRFEDVRAYRKFTGEWLPRAAARVVGPLVVWTNFLGKEPIRAVAVELGYGEAGEFVWAKRASEREGNEQLLRVYETALVFLREPLPALRPEDPQRVWCVAAGYDDEGEAGRWGSHPNHKPFAVLEPLLRQWSRPGDLVLDPFAGSGSIPAAALRLQRRAGCSEIEGDWADRVTRRLAEVTS